MSETVTVALLTFASGLFGAGIGAFVSLKTMGKESERRIHEEKQACYSQFILAYYALKFKLDEALMAMAAPDANELEKLRAQFLVGYSSSLLICAPSTVNLLVAFYFQVEKYCAMGEAPADIDIAYESLLKAMRKEIGSSKDKL